MQERLKSHSKAFESLLALTPAQEYYGSAAVDGRDPGEQWRAKKQTKAEKQAARKAKLDPANQKSALDVMQENEKKRKRESVVEEEDEQVGGDAETDAKSAISKRAKLEPHTDEQKRQHIAQKRREKRQLKKDKADRLKAKKDAARVNKHEGGPRNVEQLEADDDDMPAEAFADEDIIDLNIDGLAESVSEADFREGRDPREDDDGDDSAINDDEGDIASTAPSSPAPASPAFDISANHSTTSSSSSILPPSEPEITAVIASRSDSKLPPFTSRNLSPNHAVAAGSTSQATSSDAIPEARTTQASGVTATSSRTSSPKPIIPKADQSALQERLRARIAELRAARKADGADGKPARSRQELLEQRRKKADQRKAHKKEQRRLAKEEEARKQEERLRGSGSPLSGADIFSPRSDSTNNFSFSKLAFSDGAMADASLTKLMDGPKQKGPQDLKAALQAAENKQKRLAGLDAAKRADIGEKDLWLNASKRAHGERVRDDQSLLKKALKRKEKQKSKSEKEWQEREQAVIKGKEMKQKKRETNLAKRREEKGAKNKKKPAKKGGSKKGRPGFEGRFKA